MGQIGDQHRSQKDQCLSLWTIESMIRTQERNLNIVLDVEFQMNFTRIRGGRVLDGTGDAYRAIRREFNSVTD